MPTKTEEYVRFHKSKRCEDAGRAWLAAKASKDAAEAALKEAREALLKTLTSVVQKDDEVAMCVQGELVSAAVLQVGDRAILVQKQVRRAVDVEDLDDQVTDFVFAQVTETVVNLVAFDAAVAMGLITEDTVEAVCHSRDTLALREVKP